MDISQRRKSTQFLLTRKSKMHKNYLSSIYRYIYLLSIYYLQIWRRERDRDRETLSEGEGKRENEEMGGRRKEKRKRESKVPKCIRC